MRTGKAIVIAICLILVAGMFTVGYLLGQRSHDPSQPVGSNVACTEEAKICPDGSAVGRQGPNCEFPDCPDEVPGVKPE